MKTNLRLGRMFAILLLSVMTTGVFAQVAVPTEEIGLITDMTAFSVSDATNQAAAIASGVPADLAGQLDDGGLYMIEYLNAGDYFEYQVFAPEGGSFLFNCPINSKRTNGKVNVSVYKEGEEFVMDGKTYPVYNNSWTSSEIYSYPIDLDAAVVYNLRITVVDNGCNIEKGMTVEVVNGSIDASLSTITINGEEITGFDPETLDYSIPLSFDAWLADVVVETTPTDPNATFEVVGPTEEDIVNSPNKGVFTITCTSESGKVAATYTVTTVIPFEIYPDFQILGSTHSLYNNGLNLRDLDKQNNVNNNDYVDYYFFSYDDIVLGLPLLCANGYLDGISYLNVSVLGVNDSTWELNEIYSQQIPVTPTVDGTAGSWDAEQANLLTWVLPLKAEEPVYVRIYGITNKGNAADFWFQPLVEITESIDNTLSDLTVDGVTIDGFDPEDLSYTMAIPVGVSTVEVGATANDAEGATIEGVGSLNPLTDTARVIVTSEAGYSITYMVNFVAPLMVSDGDTLKLGDDLFQTSDLVSESSGRSVSVTNTKINWFDEGMYVDYYIYSDETKAMHVTITAANGNFTDTVYSHLNVSTFELGTEWVLDPAKTFFVPGNEEGLWNLEYANDIEYNINLEANKPVVLRLYSETNAYGSVGDLHRITFNDGVSDFVALDEVVASEIKVVPGVSSLEVRTGDEFLGGSIQVYNLAGQLISNQSLTSNVSQIRNLNKGVYIVKAINANNVAIVQKSLVR